MNPLDIDPYKILGVGKDADLEQVKSAYRRLVRMCHPDVCGRNMENIKRFLAIKDAYQLLKKRLQATGKVAVFSSSSASQERPGKDSVEGTFLFVQVGMREALYGTRVQVEIGSGEDFCTRCKGLGKVGEKEVSPCPSCQGKGYRTLNWGEGNLKIICATCSGSGTSRLKKCTQCGGRGIVVRKKKVELEIPPGTRDGTILKLENPAPGSPNRDNPDTFYVEVEVKGPPGWIIHGRDIISSADIDCWTKLGGGYLEIETIDGKMEVFVPPGLGTEKFLRIENHGWVDKKGRRGAHLIRLNVLSPKGPCPREATELINRLKAIWPCRNEAPPALPDSLMDTKRG